MTIIQQLLRFLWREKSYVLLLPLAMLFGTLIHEAAHALAAMAQGAAITEVSLFPSRSAMGSFRFGYVSYQFLREPLSNKLISLAPLISSTLLALLTSLLLPAVYPGWRAKMTLIFCFFLPITDVSMQLGGLFFARTESDYYVALHGTELLVAALALPYFLFFGWVGRRLFNLVYRERLSAQAFAVAYIALLAAPWALR